MTALQITVPEWVKVTVTKSESVDRVEFPGIGWKRPGDVVSGFDMGTRVSGWTRKGRRNFVVTAEGTLELTK